MTQINSNIDIVWVEDQINKFKESYLRYEEFAEMLQVLLNMIALGYDKIAIVQTRPKSIAGFAEKIVRKWPKYRDPLNELTDLCGGRIITHTKKQVRDISRAIEEYFIIDWENSIDVKQRLKPSEFGYRSIHYVVQLKPGGLLLKDFNSVNPEEVYGLKAEIQVRTILEHAWANMYHEWGYKNEFDIPERLEREMAALSARLEAADDSFSGIQEELESFYSSYGAYMSSEQMLGEIEKLEIVLKYDPENLMLVRQTGRLAIALEDWSKVISVLTPFENCDDPAIIKNLGVALCKNHRDNVRSAEYKKGQKLLLIAGSPPHNDPDALSSLAGSWKGIDEVKVIEYYRKAYELDPTDSYPLGNYLECEIVKEKNLSVIRLLKPAIDKALQRSRECINVGVNIPWAYYDIGKLKFLLDEPYDSFSAYAKAIELSTALFMVETSFYSLRRLKVIKDLRPDHLWIENLFLLGLAAIYENESAKKEVKKRALSKINMRNSSVVILVGGSGTRVLKKMDSYGEMLLDAFGNFKGTIISGGTTVGISKIAGDLKEKYTNNIYTIGYIPKKSTIEIDENPDRYNEILKTEGEKFSPLEATQYWIDLLASGMKPENVKLLVVNGGKISVAECKLALMLGAKVGIIEGSGGETSKIFSDPEWNTSDNLIQLPDEAAIIKSFLT